MGKKQINFEMWGQYFQDHEDRLPSCAYYDPELGFRSNAIADAIARKLGVHAINVCRVGGAINGSRSVYEVIFGRPGRGGGFDVEGQGWFAFDPR